MSDEGIAHRLNARYTDLQEGCANEMPAYTCTGVFARAISAGSLEYFWRPSQTAQALGAERYAFLRADLGIQHLQYPQGFILSGQDNGQAPVQVLCNYPLSLDLTPSRASHGCGLLDGTVPGAEQVSSCASEGVADAPSFMARYRQEQQDPRRQCSLNPRDGNGLAIEKGVRQLLQAGVAAQPNAWLVRNNTDSDVPVAPIQALYFDVAFARQGALTAAQRAQNSYFLATGNWLPILRMDVSQPATQRFDFELADQLYNGYAIASELNARYSDTRAECPDGTPGYNCNGIFLRGVQPTSAEHAWNPSAQNIQYDGISFNFLRQDANIKHTLTSTGFIFDTPMAPAEYPVRYRCDYPVDVASAGSRDRCTFQNTCQALGVDSVQGWAARYGEAEDTSCSFNPSAKEFSLNIAIRSQLVTDAYGYNEMILSAWPQNKPLDIPLQAWFYTHNALGSVFDPVVSGQFLQRDFVKQTGHFRPLLRLRIGAAQPFSYDPQEQFLVEDEAFPFID
ncbi:hypothetical protein [Pseudomonas typographi]|uniref:hypothetical protein n=1 Tax=Pseudomonas typographi TaxID=2715964 RepID=UPI00168205F7|nr:hypothetical protein [Pseudomonas typographi]MBD1587795.1 hypothetical protein [Pseudomonas typographi]